MRRLLMGIVAMGVVLAASVSYAQDSSPAQMPEKVQAFLGKLIGTWNVDGGPVRGQAAYEWDPSGNYVIGTGHITMGPDQPFNDTSLWCWDGTSGDGIVIYSTSSHGHAVDRARIASENAMKGSGSGVEDGKKGSGQIQVVHQGSTKFTMTFTNQLKAGEELPNWTGVFTRTERNGDEQELIRLQHEWSRAEVAGDVDAVDRLLADEYVLTTFEGTALTKAQLLRDVASEDTRLTAMAIENCTVRLYGNMAVVKGLCRWTEASGEKHQTLFTEPWLKRNGRWQCLTTHESKVEASRTDGTLPGPRMERLKAAVGEWTFEGQLSNPQIEDLPLPPPMSYSGTATTRFVLNGAFLETTLTVEVGGMVVMQEVTLTGYDLDADHYVERTFTRDGESDTSILTVSPDGKTWTSQSSMTTNQGKEVLGRIVTEFSAGGDSNTTVMELSEDDGKTWRLLFKHEGKKVR